MSTSRPEDPFKVMFLQVITQRVPELAHGVDYTSERIVPTELWTPWDEGTRRFAGRVLSELVDKERVQLTKTSPPYKMPVKYRRI